MIDPLGEGFVADNENKKPLDSSRSKPENLASPPPSDYSALNLESNLGILAELGIDVDDSWDMLIASGTGGVGPLGSGK